MTLKHNDELQDRTNTVIKIKIKQKRLDRFSRQECYTLNDS